VELPVSGPLLDSKMRRPRPRRALVPRPRLTTTLERVWQSTLTLVAAPPGFGKTTLLGDWAASAEDDHHAIAWLTLDRRDDDATSFWSYVIAALQSAVPGVGAGALEQLQSPRPSVQAVLATLLNDLFRLPRDVALVLDDYHAVESRDVHEAIAYVLDHLPQQFHVVLATRVDPPLPVARLRARGELLEVRAADLRFTDDEAAAYLNDTMGLALTPPDLAALDSRTEGWIAALQLAALSMQGRDDVSEFLDGFSGDDRYVVDYLTEEVLQRQPERVRDFLLETSVLSRMTGPLCDAVTGRSGGGATLESLDRQHLFVVPLDEVRHWYRYHHLFADVLRAHLLAERPEHAANLHLRASAWFESADDPEEAVHHALAGGDTARAAALVEREIPRLSRERQDATLRRWVEALPGDVVRESPVLTIGLVAARMVHGDLDGVDALLRDAERWVAGGSDLDPAARALARSIEMYRAGMARLVGDVPGTVRHARRLLDLAGEQDGFDRGAGSALLGLAHWETGDLEAASRCYGDAVASFDREGRLPDVLGCALGFGDIARARGRLDEAAASFERWLRAAERVTRSGAAAPRGIVDMRLGLAELALDRGDADAARRHLDAAAELGEAAGLAQSPCRRRIALARIAELDADLDGALALLDEAAALCDTDYSPDARPVAAERSRVLIAADRLDEAAAWARSRGLSVDDDLCYLREFEHLTLARLLLARLPAGRVELNGLLDRLLRAAEDGDRRGSVVDVLVLRALAAQAAGQLRFAVSTLARAVAEAESQGLVRPFTGHGPALSGLLRAVAGEAVAPEFAQRLLAAVGPAPGGPSQRLIDPLSGRELEVLRLLASDLDGPGIARHLFVSLNTMRTHTKHIYAKLGVTSRRAAVHRARELELLASR
jgi:LuxR family transcriptional regulator, maltose regulon positive regulatory protein